jgi:DNA polymerase-3 subunit epsilon
MQIEYTDDHNYLWSQFALDDFTHQSFWVFDVEATGIDFPSEQVTQLGGVSVSNGRIDAASTFNSFVRPNKPIPETIQRLTGITQQQVEAAPNFAEIFPRFLEKCHGHILVTQCGYEFDYPILQAECQRHGLTFPSLICLDTKAIFAYLHPELTSNFSTDFLVSFYEIDSGGLKRHDALGDALLIGLILCAEVEEAKNKGITAIRVDDVIKVKRFVLLPL